MGMALRVIESLFAEFAAREQAPLLDELIMAALPYLNQFDIIITTYSHS